MFECELYSGDEWDEVDLQAYLTDQLETREGGDPIPCNLAVRSEVFERQCGINIHGSL